MFKFTITINQYMYFFILLYVLQCHFCTLVCQNKSCLTIRFTEEYCNFFFFMYTKIPGGHKQTFAYCILY